MNSATHQSWIDAAANNVVAGEPIENIRLSQSDISTDDAYALQRQLIQQIKDNKGWGDVCGYKAALTAEVAQQAMGVHEPVIGVLFSHGARSAQANGSLEINTDRPVLLETELGFTLNQRIQEPVTPDSVKTMVSHCQGVIELAAPNLQQRPSGVDLISSNSASYGFITAETTHDPMSVVLDSLDVSLTRLEAEAATTQSSEPELLHSFAASTVMQGQWQALAWLVNRVLDQDYELEAGHLLMTGSIGNMHPATPGKYVADFAALGQLTFHL
jgi:2-keto-4-pentenoate hydratase